jgi:hypothetical protein
VVELFVFQGAAMKYLSATALLAAFAGMAAAQSAPADKVLTVHEWGVFRVNQDAEFANAEMRAAWDDLPEFAYGHIKGRAVPQHWGAAEFRRQPVIFFHAKQATQVRVKVEFPGGMAGVWFPATEKPAVFGEAKQPKVGDALEWSLAVKQLPNGWLPKRPTLPDASGKLSVARLRQVQSDEIFARYSPNRADVEREKFIYYDGIFPQGKWLAAKVDKDKVFLTSQVKHPMFDITVVDRRGDAPRIGRLDKLDGGVKAAEVAFAKADAGRFASEAADALVKQLVAAGLFEDEAKSLADLWRKEMFETPGVCLFFRLPQEEYDVRLPLTLTPKAESLVRVGLVYQGHLEPDFAEKVLELVKQLDDAKFATRDAAMKRLRAIGPAALVQLRRLRERKDISAEMRERLDALVKLWDVKEAFEK